MVLVAAPGSGCISSVTEMTDIMADQLDVTLSALNDQLVVAGASAHLVVIGAAD